MLFPQLRILFILIPLVELVLFMVLGRYFGIPGTLALIVITALLGASLTRSQGLQTLARFQQKLANGQIPGEEIIAGMLILTAGIFLITPGFLTDALGFSLLAPPVRDVLGRWMLAQCSTRAGWQDSQAPGPDRFSRVSTSSRQSPLSGAPRVIDVETTEKPLPKKD